MRIAPPTVPGMPIMNSSPLRPARWATWATRWSRAPGLERELAAFYEMRDAIVFSTGYQANLGLLSGLMGPNDVVLLDADCHASIYDGCRLAGAEVIRRFWATLPGSK